METLELFAPLFGYPDDEYQEKAARSAQATGSMALRSFADTVAGLSTGRLQELFVQAFDLNPASTLEIGWHLFGEQYERGEFLVDLRGRLREAGVAETGELPDHLRHVLPLVARLEPDDARAFGNVFLRPALQKIAAGLPADSVFGALVRGLLEHLTVSSQPSAVSAQGAPERTLTPGSPIWEEGLP